MPSRHAPSTHEPPPDAPPPQGGRATFEAIVEALRSNCPVVVVRESGGAAELVARFVDTLRPPHRNALTQQNPLCAPLAKLEPGEGNWVAKGQEKTRQCAGL